jgi:hypothetical protein
MQYTIMMQATPGINDRYTCNIAPGEEGWHFSTLEEAQTKMEELKVADLTERVYRIESYPEASN